MRKNYNLSTNGDDFLLERKMCLGGKEESVASDVPSLIVVVF